MREEPISAGEVLSDWGAAHRRAAAISATALTTFMVLLGVYAARRGPLPGEDALFDRPLISPFGGRAVNELSLGLIDLGSPIVALSLVLVFALILFAAGERIGAALTVAASGIALVTAVIKPLFGEHPLQRLEPLAHYPSGHVAFVAAVFGMVTLLAGVRGWLLLSAGLALPVVGIGPAVLIGGGHVASDVAGGYLLAAAWILVVLLIAGRRRAARTEGSEIG